MSRLSPNELARYSRHVLLPEIGEEGQTLLKNARVLIVGAGGLGSPAALYLAAAGVGTLGIADFDRVDASNLHRQLLHRDDQVGSLKTTSAKQRLEETNPFIEVKEHRDGVTAENAEQRFAEYDVIVDGTDNFASRYLNNDAAVRAERPLVFGSVYKFEGQVSVFAPHLGGPCYRCLFPNPPPAGSVPGCGEVGVLGALCGVIGSWQALEAIKLITGIGSPLMGRLLIYDALNASTSTLPFKRMPDCPACSPGAAQTPLSAAAYEAINCPTPSISSTMSDSEIPLEISITATKAILDDPTSKARLIDVREPHEFAICSIAGAVQIPMRQIPEHLGELPRDEHLLIHCHHGGRSLRVTEYLRDQGFVAVSNVAGGIQAWANEIEPDMLRY
ncbi:MAG: molybdopterin-synthase adenylyltransferase MoeB [Opitutaceae bacterium]|jgi:sulfur-carrier protein adenylyltransferase/sulfurtransferase|nr:molybdopterin-synthase adenylyltransferase MoeB [Opitutaceae bacterium]